MTLLTNALIIFLTSTDFSLQTPMYFFLKNLSLLDLSYSTVTTPRLLSDFITVSHRISFAACITQVFFFIFFASAELVLLATMSYDRYVAICYPLHYIEIMSRKICLLSVVFFWSFGLFYSLLHTLCLLRLNFCGPNMIHNFFCDLPHLYQISCTDTYINLLVVFITGSGLGLCVFAVTFFPYVLIFTTIINIKTRSHKAFSTCVAHLTVVFIFYGSIIFIYLVPTTSYLFSVNTTVSVVYAVITPLLNPVIYSLRNKDLKAALWRVLNSA
ncbi:olfactory receptor 1468-like [Gastrophryne carolinensis]